MIKLIRAGHNQQVESNEAETTHDVLRSHLKRIVRSNFPLRHQSANMQHLKGELTVADRKQQKKDKCELG